MSRVRPPKGVTREGVLRLDEDMLERWHSEVQIFWFERNSG